MNPTAHCPQCKHEVVLKSMGGIDTCPLCGFEYGSGRRYRPANASNSSVVLKNLRVFLTVFLIVAGLAAAGLAVLFVGCAMLMHN